MSFVLDNDDMHREDEFVVDIACPLLWLHEDAAVNFVWIGSRPFGVDSPTNNCHSRTSESPLVTCTAAFVCFLWKLLHIIVICFHHSTSDNVKTDRIAAAAIGDENSAFANVLCGRAALLHPQ